MPCVTKAFNEIRPGGRGETRGIGGNAHGHERDNDRHKADAIYGETDAFTQCCHQQTRNGRTHDPGGVENGRVEGNGIQQVFFICQLHDQRLARGHVEGVNGAQYGGQRQDVPYLDVSR